MTEQIPADFGLDQVPVGAGLSRHEAAVANTLGWADRAAADGDYADALAWLATLDAIGVPLPAEYVAKRPAWVSASAARTRSSAMRKHLLAAEPTATGRMLALSAELQAAADMPTLLDRALEGALALLGTDLGNIQIRHPTSGELTIATTSGFESEFLEYFAVVADDSSACGRAAQQCAQTVIVDVKEDPGFAPHREIAAAAGFRAVQSTPIVDPAGQLHGVLSTHFPARHRPTPSQMQLIKWYSESIGIALGRCRPVSESIS